MCASFTKEISFLFMSYTQNYISPYNYHDAFLFLYMYQNIRATIHIGLLPLIHVHVAQIRLIQHMMPEVPYAYHIALIFRISMIYLNHTGLI